MAYTVLNIGKMASTTVDSFVKVGVNATTDIMNGAHVVKLGYSSTNKDVYICSTPTAVTTQEVYLVDGDVIIRDSFGAKVNFADPRKFINPMGEEFRIRRLIQGDRITMTLDGFASAPTVGQYAVPANTAYTLAPAANLTGATLVAYEVLEQTTISIGLEQVVAYILEVVRAL
jgi:hypothetical protein